MPTAKVTRRFGLLVKLREEDAREKVLGDVAEGDTDDETEESRTP
jgi:hypothetical protein